MSNRQACIIYSLDIFYFKKMTLTHTNMGILDNMGISGKYPL